ncbi:MAG TPA: TRAP transporter small permease [Burkholderiaceae bacterium]|nr:TRAP transporter small permease [Burkholderiaceae bacterium]
MRRFLDTLYAAAGALAALCVLAIFVLMIVGSLGRELAWRVGIVNDLVAWLCAAAAFLAMAQAFRNGDFVRVTLLLERLPPRARRGFEVVSLAIAALAIGYLAYWAARFTYESWQFNEMPTGLLVVPLWIPQTAFVAGSLLFFIAVIDELVLVLRGAKPTYVRRVEERHARGDFSEDM